MFVLCAILAAWNFFGRQGESKTVEAPKAVEVVAAKPDPAAIQAAVSNAVQNAIDKAVSDAAARAAVAAAKEKADREAKAAAAKAARAEAKAEEKEAREIAKEERAMAEKTEAEKKAARLEELRRIETRIFKLEHASAEEVAEKFNAMWSGDFGVNWKITKMAIAFPESNTIMMTAPRAIIMACESALRDLDVEAKQVYIEARFVELGNNASHKVGIDWTGIAGGTTITATGGAGIQTTKLGDGVTEYTKKIVNGKNEESYKLSAQKMDASGNIIAGGSDGSVSYFNGTLNVSQMALTLSALDSSADAKTFSNPKIIVSSGKKATVDMTTKYPNVKISTKRTTGTSDSVDIASNLEAIPGEDKFMFAKEAFFSWGISLEVTPRISTNGLINVSIVPTISSLESWVETGTMDDSDIASGTVSTKYPVIKVQRLISEFNLASGTTAVIGGLSITEEKQVDNGIALLRYIPWFGTRIFGSMSRVKEQKEIIVFVTVGLVDPHNIREDAGLPKNAVLGRQYTKGQKLEPGDKPEKNMEGFDSLDLRELEEQSKDPLMKQPKPKGFFDGWMPFQKDPDYKEPEK